MGQFPSLSALLEIKSICVNSKESFLSTLNGRNACKCGTMLVCWQWSCEMGSRTRTIWHWHPFCKHWLSPTGNYIDNNNFPFQISGRVNCRFVSFVLIFGRWFRLLSFHQLKYLWNDHPLNRNYRAANTNAEKYRATLNLATIQHADDNR